MYTCFLNDAGLTMHGCALECSQIVYNCPYSLNTTTAFYFVTECSDVTVFFLRECACHNTFVLHGHDQGWTQCPTLDVMLYQVVRVSEQ